MGQENWEGHCEQAPSGGAEGEALMGAKDEKSFSVFSEPHFSHAWASVDREDSRKDVTWPHLRHSNS